MSINDVGGGGGGMLVQGYMKSVLTYACSGERCSQIKDAFPGGHLTSAPKEGGGGGGGGLVQGWFNILSRGRGGGG